jgi:MFS family permease
MPTFLQGHFHLSQGTAGLSATGYLNAAQLLGVLFGGVWADKWARNNIRARILVPVIGLFIAGLGIWMTGQMNRFSFAMLGLMLFGFGGAFTESNLPAILCLITEERFCATGYGLANLTNTLGAGLAIYFTGASMDAGVKLGTILTGTSGGLLFCAILLLLVKTRRSIKAPG